MFLLSGCLANSVFSYKELSPIVKVKNKSYDEVWNAVLRVAGKELTISKNNKKAGMIIAEKVHSYYPLSEVIGIQIRPDRKTPKTYNVKFIDLKGEELKHTSHNWTVSLASDLKHELGL